MVITDINSPFLSVSEAAQYVRLKKRTLDKMRCSGVGPCFRKHGGRVFDEYFMTFPIVQTVPKTQIGPGKSNSGAEERTRKPNIKKPNQN